MSQETEMIKERIDLADLIGEYVSLKKAGASFKGLCPFHNEKTPSFVVTPDKQIWHCFGCGEGGDHFSFVEKQEGLEFREVLEMLAERAGVDLPKVNQAQAAVSKDRRTRLYDLLDLTARFYREILVNQKAGEKALKYLKERGVSEEGINELQIGYAPNQWDSLQQFLQRQGFKIEEMMDVGVVGKSERGTFYDRFRGRIIFPIQDIQGRTIAFGGRILPEHSTGNEGKYVNSPETEIYSKRKVIYNLNRSKQAIRENKAAIVVEGYMDVLMLGQAGIKNVVASSGTAFTAEQVKQLSRYTQNLNFAFDSDSAGIKAAVAATEAALAANMRVAVIALPKGQDPADIVNRDADKAKKIFARPTSLISLLLERLKAGDAGERDVVLQQVLPLLKQVKNAVQQGEFIREVADSLSIPEDVVIDQVAHYVNEDVSRYQSETQEENGSSFNMSSEKLLIGLAILEPAVIEKIAQEKDHLSWQEAGVQELISKLSSDQDISQLPAALSLAALAQDHLKYSKEDVEYLAGHLIARIKRQTLHNRLKQLQSELVSQNQRQKGKTLREVKEVTSALAALV